MEYILRIELKKREEPITVAGRTIYPTGLGHHTFTAATDEEAREIARKMIRKALTADLFRLLDKMHREDDKA